MLKKLQLMLDKFKKNKNTELMDCSLETVQSYFAMQDTNKWLRFNAINKEQLERTERFEQNLEDAFRKMYVPEYEQDKINELARYGKNS